MAGGRPGFVNPALYGLYRSNAFHDVSNAPAGSAWRFGDVINYDAAAGRPMLNALAQTGRPQTIPGYDDVTGLGSPTGN